MIHIKEKIKYLKFKLTIHYFKIERINDFNYLIVLLASKAIEEKVNFNELLLKFTKGDNDYYLILKKTFEKLFTIKIENFLEKKNEILESKKLVKTTKKVSEDIELFHLENIDKYLYGNNNDFWDENDIKEDITKKFNTNNKKFIDVQFENTKKEIQKNEDFHLSKDFNYFNLRNLDKQKNKSILDLLIKNLKEKAYNFLPEEIDLNTCFIDFKKYNQNLKQINRNYSQGKSPYIEVINIEDKLLDEKIEININKKDNVDEIILSKFCLYKSIPFVNEEIISYSNFKEKEIYKKFLKIVSSNKKIMDDSFKKIFIKYAETKEEFKIINKDIDFKINVKDTLNKIDLMIINNVDIINDLSYIEHDMYDQMIKNKFIYYYKYLSHFYPSLIKKMNESKIISLLNEVYLKNSKILSPKDLEWITKIRNDRKKAYDELLSKASKFNSERGWKDKVLSKINKLKEQDENKNYNKKIDDLSDGLENWNKIINFFSHFTQVSSKRDKKTEEFIFKLYPKLLDIKNRLILINKDDISTYKINFDDLNHLDEIYEHLIKFKKKLEKVIG